MSRPAALVFGIGVVLATLLPMVLEPFGYDSYPFSTYPMFARPAGKRWLVFAEGVGANKRQPIRLGPELVANDEPMQASRTLKKAASDGAPALRVLCNRIAQRVAAAAQLADIRRVRIVGGEFDPILYFEQGAGPAQREVLQDCRVRRPR